MYLHVHVFTCTCSWTCTNVHVHVKLTLFGINKMLDPLHTEPDSTLPITIVPIS